MAPVVLLLYAFSCGAAVGESKADILVLPYGARMRGMGEVGTALADDECMVFTNPAGLGQPAERWRYGAQTIAFERLLPAFGVPELWHTATSFVFHPAWEQWSEDMGGFGISWNYVNLGKVELDNGRAGTPDTINAWEGAWSIGWGFPFAGNGRVTHYVGLFATWCYTSVGGVTYTEFGDANAINSLSGRSVAFDVGYLVDIFPGVRLGVSLQNMGPPLHYYSGKRLGPLPFTINLGLAFTREYDIGPIRAIAAAAEYRAEREFVKTYGDKGAGPFWKAIRTDWADSDLEENMEEIIHHWGAEITAINTFSSRFGFMKDAIGYRTELSWGVGAHWLNHFNLDFGVIYSPDGMSVARHGQWHFSFSVHDLWCWDRKRDFEWWRVVDET
jgi:hypothetical protein